MTKKETKGCITRKVRLWYCDFNDGHTEIRVKMPKKCEMKNIRNIILTEKMYALSLEEFIAKAREVID